MTGEEVSKGDSIGREVREVKQVSRSDRPVGHEKDFGTTGKL